MFRDWFDLDEPWPYAALLAIVVLVLVIRGCDERECVEYQPSRGLVPTRVCVCYAGEACARERSE